jgi:hypothetical protein
LLALRSPVLTVVVLKSVSREYNIAGELDTNHQWFQHFLSEINVCLNVIDSKTQHEEISDSD